MPRPRKIAYEKFAQFVASGLSLAESYRRTTGQTKNADVKGDQWHGYAGIKERIQELKAQNSKASELSREELLAFLSDVVTTPAGEITGKSRLCQSIKRTNGNGWETTEVKLPDKLVAVQIINPMCGFEKPSKVELTGDSLSRYIVELRRRPIGGGPVIDLENGSPAELENGEEHRG
jgi:Terminase small subunit